MANIIRINTKGLDSNPPFSSIYKRWKEMEKKDYDNLLEYLYSGDTRNWKNPVTKVSISRSSNIIISYLSIRYYYYHFYDWDDDASIIIGGDDLTYRDHILRFISLNYLYNPLKKTLKLGKKIAPTLIPSPPRVPSPPLAGIPSPARSPSPARVPSPPLAGIPSPRVPSPPRLPSGRASPGLAAQAGPYMKSSSSSSPPAARNKKATLKPGAARGSPGAARGSSASSDSSNKLVYSPKKVLATVKSMSKLSVNADKMSESKCKKFIKDIREAKRGKTAEEIKTMKVKIENPVTNGTITSFNSPIIQSYLVKCYFDFDDEKLKKNIKKVVDIDTLKVISDSYIKVKKKTANARLVVDKMKEDARVAAEKWREAKRLADLKAVEDKKLQIPALKTYIDGLIDEFNHYCDELVIACDTKVVNGKTIYTLKDRTYIDNIINTIVVIIYTRYLHFPHFYDASQINYNGKMDVKIIMYDEEMYDYHSDTRAVSKAKQREKVEERQLRILNSDFPIIYQNDKLLQDLNNMIIDIIPKTTNGFYINTLYNRQYEFDIFKSIHGNYELKYNRVNVLDSRAPGPFSRLAFPQTLDYAKKLILVQRPFNYNIANSTLPKYLLVSSMDDSIIDIAPFKDIIEVINARLQTLPVISGFANELTVKNGKFYEILQEMKRKSFGDNETGYGNEHMIRKNILYSLNAQDPKYIARNRDKYRDEIFYDSEYTGVFPLFTWVPLKNNLAYDIYNFPSLSKWQPYGVIHNNAFVDAGNAYKNYGISPWSKSLNDTIYRVITGELASVIDLVHLATIDRMKRRINDTLGVYKDMGISPAYKNKKVYLYHGSHNRLHTMKNRDEDIEILGFLSTSLNMYTASYYSGVGTYNKGFIYIIEADDRQGYINLNDQLYQIILLPYSVVKIVMELKFGDVVIVLCRLIMTPAKKVNNDLYNKLLDIRRPAGAATGGSGSGGSGKNDYDTNESGLSGGIGTLKQIMDAKKAQAKAVKAVKATKAAKASSNHIIYPKADMRKIGDMPESIREYYGLTKEHDDKMVDINNGCHFRVL